MKASIVQALRGQRFSSELRKSVSYRLEQPIGEGGMAIAFYALREAPEGTTPAVLKIVRPEVVGSAGPTASLMIRKEAIALGRLNERVPPTPFVVRFMDTGTIELPKWRLSDIPWLAIEYVHGGPEGTTLEERVQYSIEKTGNAFDCQRAAYALECLSEGLDAVHEVNVIHRDLTPGNVLCCGFGANEVFKIADFGLARPEGVTATFGNVLLGTPAYCAPEQAFPGSNPVGRWTDVFSLACLAFFMLTGEEFFESNNFAQVMMKARSDERRSVLDCSALCEEMKARPDWCRSVDLALKSATAGNGSERPPSARLFASTIVPVLRAFGPRSHRASSQLVQGLGAPRATRTLSGWDWTIRHPTGDDRLIRSVAWDSDGHCLATTTEGLAFWNGTNWAKVPLGLPFDSAKLRFVSLIRPGLWMVGGPGILATVRTEGATTMLGAPKSAALTHGSGDPEDFALLTAEYSGVPPYLYLVAAARFFQPLRLEGAASVTGLARIEDAKWLITGRNAEGRGFVAIASPLAYKTVFLKTPNSDAFLSCAGEIEHGVGLAVGRQGSVLHVSSGNVVADLVPGSPDLASAAVDLNGRCWVAGLGRIWSKHPETDRDFGSAWHSSEWQTPFVSLRADLGVVNAVTVDGAVVEGRTANFRASQA